MLYTLVYHPVDCVAAGHAVGTHNDRLVLIHVLLVVAIVLFLLLVVGLLSGRRTVV